MILRLDGFGVALGSSGTAWDGHMNGTQELLSDAPNISFAPDDIQRFVPRSGLRRMSDFQKLSLLAARLAMENANLPNLPADAGVVVSTGFGPAGTTFEFIDSIVDLTPKMASPTSFSNSVHNSAATAVSINMNLQGPVLTVSQFDLSFTSALISAACSIFSGQTDVVLLGAVDDPNQVLADYAERMANEAPGFKSEGFLPGDDFMQGAVFFLLRAAGKNDFGAIVLDGMCIDSPDRMFKEISADSVLIPGRNALQALSDAPAGLISADIRSFGQVFGSTPSRQAFDLALCVHALKTGLGLQTSVSGSRMAGQGSTLNDFTFIETTPSGLCGKFRLRRLPGDI